MTLYHTIQKFYAHKRILITGHTGFKGTWLSLILKHLGAQVMGYALPAENLSLYNLVSMKSQMNDQMEEDIRKASYLDSFIKKIDPEVVFHLAAQPFVIDGYKDAPYTFDTNVMGTVNLLESLKSCKNLKGIVVITTDKCYDNKEWVWPYRENDPLGGYDPYSASKACAELVSASYAKSFFQHIPLCTARAGNIIGGGDFSKDRLIPNVIKAIQNQQPVHLRFPSAIRPWQYILDVLYGYLLLGYHSIHNPALCGAYNFSLGGKDYTVEHIVESFIQSLETKVTITRETPHYHEAGSLTLDTNKARTYLKWASIYDVKQTLHHTALWYQKYLNKYDMQAWTLYQIKDYMHQLS